LIVTTAPKLAVPSEQQAVATDEIRAQITGVQKVTAETVEAIMQVESVIRSISQCR
jgi:hypothetical protein